MQTKIIKSGRKWQWQLLKGRSAVAGGWCKTKSDAINDADIAFKSITLSAPTDTTTVNGLLLQAAAIIDARANHVLHPEIS
ncbi:hypothetical protein UFOVP736_67 [uncultured Caudovirales phage]|uniref:Uncharacterized protein n=1 Tax=uncultured Caudovirales phage TaxID=2100421 RepID=A0A6J5NLL0_9CAUD|nr:hypothetical protein UFOVP705_14 [uncultured Caudovirales phage]CAB5224389.1 hypothetical protein UFOVP736_67 [uncultured Caudovirales phage]